MATEWLEYSAVAFNIAYVLLAAKENILCWPMGIIGSGLSIWLFIESKIYAEAFLFAYYVLMGVYGWWAWSKGMNRSGDLMIRTLPVKTHLLILLVGYGFTALIYFLLKTFTDAQLPLLDSFTTGFSFLATWMVAKRILENWIYWICIDALTIYLYLSRDLHIYALLSLAFTFMAVYGFFKWKNDFQNQHGLR